jgi:hypothetical protein
VVHLQSQLGALLLYLRDLILHLALIILFLLATTRDATMMVSFLLLSTAAHGVNNKVHLGCNISKGFSQILRIIKKWAGREGLDPVLVPEGLEDLRVESRLEEGVLKLIVFLGMQTEILHLVLRYHALA